MKKYVWILVLVALGFVIFKAVKSVDEVMTNQDFSQNYFDSEDSLLFKSEMLKHIEIKKVAKSDLRNPIKYFKYKNLYNLYTTKIDVKKGLEMENIIYFTEKVTSKNSLTVYMDFQSNKFYDISFRGEKVAAVSKIFFSMSGEGKKLKRVVYNRKFVSYCMPIFTFSLNYNKEDNPIDIFVGTGNSFKLTDKGVPFIISFYQKESSVFVFLMTPILKNTEIKEDVLNEFIKHW